MPQLRMLLDLDRCPYCQVDRPQLTAMNAGAETKDYTGKRRAFWRFYLCHRCGGVVTAASVAGFDQNVSEYLPGPAVVDDAIPERAREYLQQAIDSLHAPAGAVMLAASSVDAMLKKKGYTDGSLYARIDKASADHVITPEMAQWAHKVRLDANDQRHADQEASLPTSPDAERSIEFTTALGHFMFVLPARIQEGLQKATSSSPSIKVARPTGKPA